MAKLMWFICGGSCFPGEVLAAAIFQCDRHTIQITYTEGYDRLLIDQTESGRIALLQLSIWNAKFKEKPPLLLELLVLFRYTLVTHARDHFFALIGLAGDAGGLNLILNMQNRLSQLQRDTQVSLSAWVREWTCLDGLA